MRSNSTYLETLIIVCRVKKVNIPAEIAASKIKKIFSMSSVCTISISVTFPFLNSSMTLTEFLIRPGVNNNKILAIIIIKNPNRRFVLYFNKYLFKYFNSFKGIKLYNY